MVKVLTTSFNKIWLGLVALNLLILLFFPEWYSKESIARLLSSFGALLCAAEAGCVIASATVTWQTCCSEISAVGSSGDKRSTLLHGPRVSCAMQRSSWTGSAVGNAAANLAKHGVLRERKDCSTHNPATAAPST